MSDAASARSLTVDRRHRSVRRGHLLLVGVLIAAVVLLGFAGGEVRQLLRYERSGVLHGEWWRLFTGHLVHVDLRHLMLNTAGLALVAQLFGRDYPVRQWLFILVTSALVIDVAFVFCEPQLEWYVGLSGILHGAVAAGLLAWWRYENRLLTLAIAAIVSGKLIWEQGWEALPFSGDMPVITEAHLYGAIGGLMAAGLLEIFQRLWPRGSRSL